MSQVKDRMPSQAARAHAQALQMLFAPETFARWEFAGSLRRGREDVGDIEHVVIPAVGTAQRQNGLFMETVENVNLLYHRLDELLEAGTIAKALDAAGRTCWGLVKRAALYRGVRHEFYLATEDNWGVRLAIHTGPAQLSQHLVTVIRNTGYRFGADGFHVYPKELDEKITVSTEQEFFGVCGVRYVEPAERDLLWQSIGKARAAERRGDLR